MQTSPISLLHADDPIPREAPGNRRRLHAGYQERGVKLLVSLALSGIDFQQEFVRLTLTFEASLTR